MTLKIIMNLEIFVGLLCGYTKKEHILHTGVDLLVQPKPEKSLKKSVESVK